MAGCATASVSASVSSVTVVSSLLSAELGTVVSGRGVGFFSLSVFLSLSPSHSLALAWQTLFSGKKVEAYITLCVCVSLGLRCPVVSFVSSISSSGYS